MRLIERGRRRWGTMWTLPGCKRESMLARTRGRRCEAAERLLAQVAGGFGITTLVLAGLKLFATFSQSVTRRAREIGIRMALGADVRTVRRASSRKAFCPRSLLQWAFRRRSQPISHEFGGGSEFKADAGSAPHQHATHLSFSVRAGPSCLRESKLLASYLRTRLTALATAVAVRSRRSGIAAPYPTRVLVEALHTPGHSVSTPHW